MSICNLPNIDLITRFENVNERILQGIMILPDKVRKEIRLLAKQYQITQIYQESPIMCRDKKIRESPYVIKYKEYYSDDEFACKIFIDEGCIDISVNE